MGIILTEFFTNTAKHARINNEKIQLKIKLKIYESGHLLTVADTGSGLPDDFDKEKPNSMGIKLIREMLAQLGGDFHYKNDNGAVFTSFLTEL